MFKIMNININLIWLIQFETDCEVGGQATIQLLEYGIPTAAPAPPKSPRLTHYPTANTLSNG